MSPRLTFLLAPVFCALLHTSALAGSTSALSISDSISTSVGSLSDSVSGASTSAKDAVVFHEGDYRIVDIAQGDAAADTLRLTLQPVGQDDPAAGLYLTASEQAITRAGLQPGQLIAARARPYGMAVYGEAAADPFVLLLADTWRPRLDARSVTL